MTASGQQQSPTIYLLWHFTLTPSPTYEIREGVLALFTWQQFAIFQEYAH